MTIARWHCVLALRCTASVGNGYRWQRLRDEKSISKQASKQKSVKFLVVLNIKRDSKYQFIKNREANNHLVIDFPFSIPSSFFVFFFFFSLLLRGFFAFSSYFFSFQADQKFKIWNNLQPKPTVAKVCECCHRIFGVSWNVGRANDEHFRYSWHCIWQPDELFVNCFLDESTCNLFIHTSAHRHTDRQTRPIRHDQFEWATVAMQLVINGLSSQIGKSIFASWQLPSSSLGASPSSLMRFDCT